MSGSCNCWASGLRGMSGPMVENAGEINIAGHAAFDNRQSVQRCLLESATKGKRAAANDKEA